MTHVFESDCLDFKAIKCGITVYDILKTERDIKAGDKIVYQEVLSDSKLTGEEVTLEVQQTTVGMGLKTGYVIVGYLPYTELSKLEMQQAQ